MNAVYCDSCDTFIKVTNYMINNTSTIIRCPLCNKTICIDTVNEKIIDYNESL